MKPDCVMYRMSINYGPDCKGLQDMTCRDGSPCSFYKTKADIERERERLAGEYLRKKGLKTEW